jgi:hypothetical protein
MRTILIATTAAIALSSAAWAASDNSTSNTGPESAKVRQDLTQMLQKSGYTDIRVATVVIYGPRKGPEWRSGRDVHQPRSLRRNDDRE